jgi:hypothetical protein
MPARPFSLARLLNRLTSDWNKIAAVGGWLSLLIASFLLPPPIGASQFGGDEGIVGAFGRFIVPVFAGLIIVPMSRWALKRHTWAWWKAAAAGLALSVLVFLAYQWLTTHWTAPYDGRLWVIGSEYMPGREQWVRDHPEFAEPSKLIMAHGGQVLDIWTKASINWRCAALAAFYLFSLPLFALAVICMIQAIYCNSRPPSPSARRQPPTDTATLTPPADAQIPKEKRAGRPKKPGKS